MVKIGYVDGNRVSWFERGLVSCCGCGAVSPLRMLELNPDVCYVVREGSLKKVFKALFEGSDGTCEACGEMMAVPKRGKLSVSYPPLCSIESIAKTKKELVVTRYGVVLSAPMLRDLLDRVLVVRGDHVVEGFYSLGVIDVDPRFEKHPDRFMDLNPELRMSYKHDCETLFSMVALGKLADAYVEARERRADGSDLSTVIWPGDSSVSRRFQELGVKKAIVVGELKVRVGDGKGGYEDLVIVQGKTAGRFVPTAPFSSSGEVPRPEIDFRCGLLSSMVMNVVAGSHAAQVRGRAVNYVRKEVGKLRKDGKEIGFVEYSRVLEGSLYMSYCDEDRQPKYGANTTFTYCSEDELQRLVAGFASRLMLGAQPKKKEVDVVDGVEWEFCAIQEKYPTAQDRTPSQIERVVRLAEEGRSRPVRVEEPARATIWLGRLWAMFRVLAIGLRWLILLTLFVLVVQGVAWSCNVLRTPQGHVPVSNCDMACDPFGDPSWAREAALCFERYMLLEFATGVRKCDCARGAYEYLRAIVVFSTLSLISVVVVPVGEKLAGLFRCKVGKRAPSFLARRGGWAKDPFGVRRFAKVFGDLDAYFESDSRLRGVYSTKQTVGEFICRVVELMQDEAVVELMGLKRDDIVKALCQVVQMMDNMSVNYMGNYMDVKERMCSDIFAKQCSFLVEQKPSVVAFVNSILYDPAGFKKSCTTGPLGEDYVKSGFEAKRKNGAGMKKAAKRLAGSSKARSFLGSGEVADSEDYKKFYGKAAYYTVMEKLNPRDRSHMHDYLEDFFSVGKGGEVGGAGSIGDDELTFKQLKYLARHGDPDLVDMEAVEAVLSEMMAIADANKSSSSEWIAAAQSDNFDEWKSNFYEDYYESRTGTPSNKKELGGLLEKVLQKAPHAFGVVTKVAGASKAVVMDGSKVVVGSKEEHFEKVSEPAHVDPLKTAESVPDTKRSKSTVSVEEMRSVISKIKAPAKTGTAKIATFESKSVGSILDTASCPVPVVVVTTFRKEGAGEEGIVTDERQGVVVGYSALKNKPIVQVMTVLHRGHKDLSHLFGSGSTESVVRFRVGKESHELKITDVRMVLDKECGEDFDQAVVLTGTATEITETCAQAVMAVVKSPVSFYKADLMTAQKVVACFLQKSSDGERVPVFSQGDILSESGCSITHNASTVYEEGKSSGVGTSGCPLCKIRGSRSYFVALHSQSTAGNNRAVKACRVEVVQAAYKNYMRDFRKGGN